MKNFVYIFLISVFSLVSCNKWLEVTPRDFLSPEDYYTNEKELQTALSGVYSTFLRSGTFLNNLGRIGLDGDEAWNHREIGSVENYKTSPNDEKIKSFWRDYYEGIARANMLLQNIEKLNDGDAIDRHIIKGEALFLRAFFYFNLVVNFGDVPLILRPIETAKLEELRPERTTATQVYAQIIRDLEEAAELVLPIEEVHGGGRVNKSAVFGLLARVNLYMAGYPINDKTRYIEVIKWTDNIMNNPTHKLNPSYQDVFVKLATDKYDIGESIYEIEFMGNGVGIYANLGGFVGVNNGIQNTVVKDDGEAHSYLMCTYYSYNVFESGDLRRDWSISPYTYDNDGTKNYNYISNRPFQRYVGKFRRTSETLTPKHTSRTPQNYPIIRFSDVLLMRAEAENEVYSGPTLKAIECVNMVRRRGFGLDPLVASATADLKSTSTDSYINFLRELQKERTRELSFENMRKADLVRWGIFNQKMNETYSESLSALGGWQNLSRLQEYYFNAKSSDRHLLWPIPGDEIGFNPNLTQNPGY